MKNNCKSKRNLQESCKLLAVAALGKRILCTWIMNFATVVDTRTCYGLGCLCKRRIKAIKYSCFSFILKIYSSTLWDSAQEVNTTKFYERLMKMKFASCSSSTFPLAPLHYTGVRVWHPLDFFSDLSLPVCIYTHLYIIFFLLIKINMFTLEAIGISSEKEKVCWTISVSSLLYATSKHPRSTCWLTFWYVCIRTRTRTHRYIYRDIYENR